MPCWGSTTAGQQMWQEGISHAANSTWRYAMPAVLTVIVRAAATAVPLILLSLGLLFATVVAILRPTRQRQAMVERLSRAITSVSAVIVGQTPNDQLHSQGAPR